MKAEHDRSKNKKRQLRAALIKQHKIVFGKRRSFGYAVSPFCRSFSMAAGSILPPFRRKLFFRFGFLLYSHSLSKLFLIVGYTGNHKPQMCKHTLFQNYSADKVRRWPVPLSEYGQSVSDRNPLSRVRKAFWLPRQLLRPQSNAFYHQRRYFAVLYFFNEFAPARTVERWG